MVGGESAAAACAELRIDVLAMLVERETNRQLAGAALALVEGDPLRVGVFATHVNVDLVCIAGRLFHPDAADQVREREPLGSEREAAVEVGGVRRRSLEASGQDAGERRGWQGSVEEIRTETHDDAPKAVG
jgi:hypothetical protein